MNLIHFTFYVLVGVLFVIDYDFDKFNIRLHQKPIGVLV